MRNPTQYPAEAINGCHGWSGKWGHEQSFCDKGEAHRESCSECRPTQCRRGPIQFLFTFASNGFVERYMSALLVWTALSILNFSIAATLGIALFKVQNWSRWAVIAVGVYWLLLLPREASAAHGIVDIVYAGIRTLFCVWVIWYLSRPKIKAAFREA